MTPPMAAMVESAADARWLAWRARGAVSDRRSGLIMGRLFAVVVILVVGWLVAQFR
jgi:tetrahydromethanopterin S-methyltransferase subunit F